MSDAPTTSTPARVIAVGASAGGLTPLRSITSALPPGFPATVLVVMHLSSTTRSVLPEILARTAEVAVSAAHDGAELRPGRVMVAPPDHHLSVEDGHARLSRGPRENGHRPSVDTLFRSVAEVYGPAACGVILSGTRDDGTLGLAEVKARGGVAIVQDPQEALHDGMPANALAGTAVDYLLPADRIGPLLVELAHGRRAVEAPTAPGPAPEDAAELLSVLCPECGGSLYATDKAGVDAYHCHVGHRFTTRSLLAAHADGVERAMWTAVRTLEDRATLMQRMAARADRLQSATSRRRYEHQAAQAEDQARVIREAIAALDDAAVEVHAEPREAAS